MTRALALLVALLALAGCGIPPAVLAGALGVAAGAERLDDDILNGWLAAKGKVAVDKPTASH